MIIDITDVMMSEGKREEKLVPVTMEEVLWVGETWPVSNRPQAAFVFTNIGSKKVLIVGRTEICLKMPCSRCLQTVEVPVRIRFAREAVHPDTVIEDDEDRIQLSEDCRFDSDDLIYHEIITNLPSKVLCREDCRGICRECGQNLNERECGCDTFVPDPRMETIRDIFDAYKEV